MRASMTACRRFVFVVAAIAPALLVSDAALAGDLNSNQLPTMTWSMDGVSGSTWDFQPTIDMFAPISGGPGFQMTSSPTFDIFGGRATITIETLAFDPDPFVLNNILVTNNTGSTQVFSAFVGIPTSFGAPNLISGVIELGVIDGGTDGATVATATGDPIYQAQIDGVTIETLLNDPYSLTAGSGGANNDLASFGPDFSNIAVNATMGIQLRFSLTAGDTASILSRFDVVAVPAPGAVALLGVSAMCFRGRRRSA